jgi:hypothetical protein
MRNNFVVPSVYTLCSVPVVVTAVVPSNTVMLVCTAAIVTLLPLVPGSIVSAPLYLSIEP